MNDARNLNDGRLAFLRRIPLFSDFEEADFQEVERLVQLQTVSRGSFVYVPGDAADQICLVRSGRVKISKSTPEGKEWILNLVEPGEVFGELALTGEETRQTSAEAVEDTVLACLRREHFLWLAGRKPNLALRLLRIVSDRRRQMETRVEWVLFAGVYRRLVELLLDLGRRYGVQVPEGLALRVHLSQKEIAHLIGSTRETTSSTLNQLRRQGLIFIQRRRLIIRSLDDLERARRGGNGVKAVPALAAARR